MDSHLIKVSVVRQKEIKHNMYFAILIIFYIHDGVAFW